MSMELQHEDLRALYGEHFYVVPGGAEKETDTGEKPEEKAVEKEEVTENASAPVAPQEIAPPTEKKQPQSEGAITWRPKPTSKVLFILHQEELRNKELTELLKKIVQSIEIPFESAGFGIVKGLPELKQFHGIPNAFGVVFDHVLNPTGDNPVEVEGGQLYFTHRLAELQDNRDYKRALWEQLKLIKSKIS